MSHFIKLKVGPEKYNLFQIPEEVQKYIIQLEKALQEGDKGRKRMSIIYPERFKK